MHQRTIARKAIQAALLNRTAAGARVFTTRVAPLRTIEVPAISIYALNEAVTDVSAGTAPRELSRDLEVEVVGWIGIGPNVDDELDDLALEIETALHADPFLAGAVGDSILLSTEITSTPDGENSMGVVKLTYSVLYRTLAPEAPANLADFLVADTRHRIVGVTDPTQDGHDTIVVQEAP